MLLRDPVSTSLEEFQEQMEVAKRCGKFVQFSTMFVHLYAVRRFMDRVIRENAFGRMLSIDAHLHLNYNDVDKVGANYPLQPNDGAIRVLGRFCVLVSTLFFNRVGCFAKSAQVHSMKTSKDGVGIAAVASVRYGEVRERNKGCFSCCTFLDMIQGKRIQPSFSLTTYF